MSADQPPPAVGIDLGTTYSVVAWVNPDGDPEVIANTEGATLTPSVVSLAGGPDPVVGSAAKADQARGATEVAHSFKRSMGTREYAVVLGGRSWTPIDLSALVLGHLKRQAEAALSLPVTRAVVTVPEYFTHPQRAATMDAGRLAGLDVRRIISEPTAAALAYGLRPGQQTRRVLVYDLGGGTFDISLVEIGSSAIRVISSEGDHELGGRDWDDRLARLVLSKVPEHAAALAADQDVLLVEVERLKRALSARRSAELRLVAGATTVRCEVTRDEFGAATRDLLEQTGLLTAKVLEETGLDWADLDGVLPVGGSTRMPMVHQWIERVSRKPPMGGVHPDHAVALGAAAQAAILLEAESGLRLGAPGGSSARTILRISAPRLIGGVVTHSLGMIAENEAGNRYINSVLLRRNAQIPCTETRPYQFYVRGDGDDIMEIFLTQGETDDPAPCAYLGRYVVTGFDTGSSRHTVVDVTYAYDDNALVGVTATDRSTGSPLDVRVSSLPEDIPQRFLEPPKRSAGREPMTIYLSFDISGSMSGTPLVQAKKAAGEFVRQVDLTSTGVGLIAFSDRVHVTQTATHNAVEIERAISGLTVGSTGYGNATHPFDDLHRLLSGLPGRGFGVVLADGVWSNQNLAAQRAKRCHGDGIEIVAVGFGSADERFLRDIASSTEQAMFTNLGELTTVFGTIAREITERGARAR